MLLLWAGCAVPVADPVVVEDYRVLAEAAVDAGSWDKAVVYYRRILQVDPARTEVRYDLLLALLRLEKWDEAEVQGRALLVSDPGNSLLLEQIAYLEARTGREDHGYRMYRDLFDSGVRRTSVLRNLAIIAHRLDKPSEELAWWLEVEKTGALAQADAQALIVAGFRAGQDEVMIARVESWLASAGDKDDPRISLVTALFAGGLSRQGTVILAPLLARETLAVPVQALSVWALMLNGGGESSVMEGLQALAVSKEGKAELKKLLDAFPKDWKARIQSLLDSGGSGASEGPVPAAGDPQPGPQASPKP